MDGGPGMGIGIGGSRYLDQRLWRARFARIRERRFRFDSISVAESKSKSAIDATTVAGALERAVTGSA